MDSRTCVELATDGERNFVGQLIDQTFAAVVNKRTTDFASYSRQINGAQHAREIFRGAHPVSLAHGHLKHLADRSLDYHVTWKTDGVRCLLVLTEKVGCFLVDRNDRVYRLYGGNPHAFDEHLHTSIRGCTIFDAEIVEYRTPGNFLLFVFDVMLANGDSIVNLPLAKRLGVIQTRYTRYTDRHIDLREIIIRQTYDVLTAHTMTLVNKSFYPIAMLKRFCDMMNAIGWHGSDGMLFVSMVRTYRAREDDGTYKYKRPEDITSDFYVRLSWVDPSSSPPRGSSTPDSVRLRRSSNGGDVYVPLRPTDPTLCVSLCCINEGQHVVRHTQRETDGQRVAAWCSMENGIAECRFDTGRERFDPVKLRTDKQRANSVRTVDANMASIRDPVLLDDIAGIIAGVAPAAG